MPCNTFGRERLADATLSADEPCVGPWVALWKFTGCIQLPRLHCPSEGSPAEVDSLPRRLWNVNTAFFKIAIDPSSRAAFGFAMVGAHRSCYRPGIFLMGERRIMTGAQAITRTDTGGWTDGWTDRWMDRYRWKMDMQ